MIPVKCKKVILFLFLVLASVSASDAAENELTESAAVIGSVPVSTAGITRDMYHRVDRLVPELKKIPAERVILLECFYDGKAGKEKEVSGAFNIAAQVEKYLREYHKLHIDLWLSAHPKAPGNPSALTFSVLAQSYRNLDRVQADAAMTRD